MIIIYPPFLTLSFVKQLWSKEVQKESTELNLFIIIIPFLFILQSNKQSLAAAEAIYKRNHSPNPINWPPEAELAFGFAWSGYANNNKYNYKRWSRKNLHLPMTFLNCCPACMFCNLWTTITTSPETQTRLRFNKPLSCLSTLSVVVVDGRGDKCTLSALWLCPAPST